MGKSCPSLFSSEVKLLRSVTWSILVQNKSDINQQVQSLFQQSRFRVRIEKENLTLAGEEIKKGTYQFCTFEKQNIVQLFVNLKKDITTQLKQLTLILNNTELNLNNLRPRNVLKRGYSITQLNGKPIRSFDQVKEGELLNTILYEGSVLSMIKSASKPLKNE